MPEATDRVTALLERAKLVPRVRAEAFDAFHAAGSATELEPLLRRLPLSQSVRRELWDLKSNEKDGDMLPREMRQGRYGDMLPDKQSKVMRSADDLSGASVKAGAQHPAKNTARIFPDVDRDRHGPIGAFIDAQYHHFNAATLKDAAHAYIDLLDHGGQMFVSMAGAMSTAQLGRSLAPMIREKKVHALCCTGANLEEDLFNLVAHQEYERFPDYDSLKPAEEHALYRRNVNRVTDVGIPEKAAMTPIEKAMKKRWEAIHSETDRRFPHELLYDIITSRELADQYQGDEANSWLCAAAEEKLPLFVPGWEDSTLGNVFAAEVLSGELAPWIMRSGIEYMTELARWYRRTSKRHDLGFFQIGGGIPGDFAICVVPLLEQDAHEKDTKKWRYFCQVSDAVTSYGGYSGATPNEKITWGKLDPDTPSFAIESDASIVVPLIFGKVLGW